MKTNLTFKTRDGFVLSAVLHSPDTIEVKAYALFAHCFTCTKSINSAVQIAESLSETGLATLRFDFTGLGASKGEFADTSFTTNVHDLIDAAEFLSQQYQAPQLLVGHSLGGTAVLAAASQLASVKAVATIGSPAHPEHVLHNLEGELDTLAKAGVAEVDLEGRTFVFRQCFVDDVKNYQLEIDKIDTALLVLHSPIDAYVSIEQASKIYQAAKHPKSFITLDNADHLLNRIEDAHYAGQLITSWAKRYLVIEKHPQQQGVVVSADTSQKFLNKVSASGHYLVVDEPKSYGGNNLGPTPYDLLAAALGSCTAMTLNMYARKKKLQLDNVTVKVEHQRVHADDCQDCSESLELFTRFIKISGNLTEEQKARMFQIADRCPVHKTLEGKVKIISQQIDE